MHSPTYLILMIGAALFGLVNLVHNWYTNKLLFVISIVVLLITLYGALLQLSNAEDWEIKWMLVYILPMGLTVFGQALGITEIQNQVLGQAGISPLPSIFPGLSTDYFAAARNQYISMAYPFAAKLIAYIVGLLFECN